MEYLSITFVSIGFSFLVSFVAVAYFRETFKNVFVEICGTETRAVFWTGFCNLCIFIVPLIFTLFSLKEPDNDHNYKVLYFHEFLRVFKWALIGLMMMIGTIGTVLSSFANEKK